MILRHVKNDHENEKDKVEFDMKMTKSFTKPISRIIDEGIRIKNRPKGTLLNTKHEYFAPSVKRKVVEYSNECDLCGKKFGNPISLKNHKSIYFTIIFDATTALFLTLRMFLYLKMSVFEIQHAIES